MTAHKPAGTHGSCVPVPAGDRWIARDHLACRSLAIVTRALCEVDMIASVHEAVAPASATHLKALVQMLSSDTLDWLRAWPH